MSNKKGRKMTTPLIAMIIRPVEGDDLDAQGASFEREARVALDELADDVSDVRLTSVSDQAVVNVGSVNEPHYITLWQLRLVGAIFEASGLLKVDGDIINADHESGRFEIAGVLRYKA